MKEGIEMLTYEFDTQCQTFIALNEKRTPLLFRKHDDRYEPAVFAVKAIFKEETMTIDIQSVDAIVYWDYKDGLIKREELTDVECRFPSILKLDIEKLSNQANEIEFYSNLEVLRVSLDAGCVTPEIEQTYVTYLKAHGIDSYKMEDYL